MSNALEDFAANSFHVFLSAYVVDDDERTDREEWIVAGKPRTVHIGTMGTKGQFPATGVGPAFWFPTLQELIESVDLPDGTHWVRLFFAQYETQTATCELLLDNSVWDVGQDRMAALSWPKSTDYYSVRVFLILQDGAVAQQYAAPLPSEGAPSKGG